MESIINFAFGKDCMFYLNFHVGRTKSIKVFENYLNILVDNSSFCQHTVPCKNATTLWFIMKDE